MWISEPTRRSRRTGEPCPGLAGTDEASLRAWVERFAVPRHRLAEPRANLAAGERIADEFASLGYEVRVQGRYRNVVALPRARGEFGVRCVAAHYDSVPGCPGADDNASALAAMLACARSMAASERRPHVGFVAFNAEEDGLLGSRDFASVGMGSLPCRVLSVHVLEMLGYRGEEAPEKLPLPWVPPSLRKPDFLGLVAKGASNASVDVAAKCEAGRDLRLVTLKTWGPLHRLMPDLRRSDHFPFWMCGVPAVLWTDTGNFRNPHYHRASDTPDTLDYAFLRSATELLFEVVWRESFVSPY